VHEQTRSATRSATPLLQAERAPSSTTRSDDAYVPSPNDRQLAPAEGSRFGDIRPTDDARRVANWVVRTRDNQRLPFLIIDKVAAAVFVFDVKGRARAAAPVLLGISKGDRFAPGSAEKDMNEIAVSERITPAGRFVAERGIDDKGRNVVWIAYDAGVALHAVLDNPGERRPQRLQSVSPEDNRISYGCVNVPGEFFTEVVWPLFSQTKAVVYVLPDSEPGLVYRTDADARGGLQELTAR
jgi:hypothetical protein